MDRLLHGEAGHILMTAVPAGVTLSLFAYAVFGSGSMVMKLIWLLGMAISLMVLIVALGHIAPCTQGIPKLLRQLRRLGRVALELGQTRRLTPQGMFEVRMVDKRLQFVHAPSRVGGGVRHHYWVERCFTLGIGLRTVDKSLDMGCSKGKRVGTDKATITRADLLWANNAVTAAELHQLIAAMQYLPQK